MTTVIDTDSHTDPDDVPARPWTVEEVRARFVALGPVLDLDWMDRMPTEVAVLIREMRIAGGQMTPINASNDLMAALDGRGWGRGWVPDPAQIRRAQKTWYARTGQANNATPNPRFAGVPVIDPDAVYTPVPVPASHRWRDDAACLGEDPELFFSSGNTGRALVQAEKAKAVCRRCEVVDQCAGEAAEFGVWGALTEDERLAAYRKARRLARKNGERPPARIRHQPILRRATTLGGNPRPDPE